MAFTHSFSHSFSSEEKLAAQTFAADQPYTRLEVSLKCEKLVETHVFADGNIEPPRKDWKCPANSRRPWHASRGQAWPPPCDIKYTPPPGSNAWMPLRNGTVLQALYCKTPADTERFRTSLKDKAKCKHEIRFRDVADVVRDQRYQKRKNYYFFAFDDCSEFKFDVRVAGPPRPPGLHPAARPATRVRRGQGEGRAAPGRAGRERAAAELHRGGVRHNGEETRAAPRSRGGHPRVGRLRPPLPGTR